MLVVEVADEDTTRRGDLDVAGRVDDDEEAEDPILALPTTGALTLLPDDREEDDRTGARTLLPEEAPVATVFPPFPLALTAIGS